MQFKLENLFNRLCKLIPSASGKMLYNKWVLYFIFILGIYDVIHFYQRGNTMAVAIFVIVGFLTSFFSKNMIVIIVSAIAVSHIVAYGNKMSEGFEDDDKEKEEGFEEEEEGFEEGVEGEDDTEEEKPKEKKTKPDTESEEKKTTSEEFAPAIDDKGTEQLLANMNKLLKQTEGMVKTSTTEGTSKEKFTSMYAEYK